MGWILFCSYQILVSAPPRSRRHALSSSCSTQCGPVMALASKSRLPRPASNQHSSRGLCQPGCRGPSQMGHQVPSVWSAAGALVCQSCIDASAPDNDATIRPTSLGKPIMDVRTSLSTLGPRKGREGSWRGSLHSPWLAAPRRFMPRSPSAVVRASACWPVSLRQAVQCSVLPIRIRSRPEREHPSVITVCAFTSRRCLPLETAELRPVMTNPP